jgi:hypothetical protein
MIQPGDKVKDKISGYFGIVIAKTEWLNKCVRVTVASQKLEDGKPLFVEFDIEQLEILEPQAIALEKEQPTGGAKDFTPTRPQTPGR